MISIIKDNIEIVDRLEHLHETNPLGSVNMLDFAFRLADILKVLEVEITIFVTGLPYAFYDFSYHIGHNHQNTIDLVMYPAGFCFRYSEICLKFENLFFEEMLGVCGGLFPKQLFNLVN